MMRTQENIWIGELAAVIRLEKYLKNALISNQTIKYMFVLSSKNVNQNCVFIVVCCRFVIYIYIYMSTNHACAVS